MPPYATTRSHAEFSIPSIIAIVAAIASFMVGAFWGLVLALIAIVFGLVGVALAFSPKIRGGMTSTLSLIGGFLGLVAAFFKAVAWLLG
jgi:hypothetical protein